MDTSIVTQDQQGMTNSSPESFKKAVDGLLKNRQYFIDQVLPTLKDKSDYHIILGRRSLAKGGAEKLASIYNLVATFETDRDALEMLKAVQGLVAFRCDLLRNGQIQGQGRGSATLAQNQGDANKTLKMAQKRAFVDAVIRATGLSDIFTSDLEDMPLSEIKGEVPTIEYEPVQPASKPFVQEKKAVFTTLSQVGKCPECGKPITQAEISYSQKKYNKVICYGCQHKGQKEVSA